MPPTRGSLCEATAVQKPEYVLVLRTCKADMKSTNDFIWPASGYVEAPDWSQSPVCGHGLHGLLWGEGDGALLAWDADAKWLVVKVNAADVVDLGGKIKFPRGEVVFCGDRIGATGYLAANGGAGRKVAGGVATAGNRGTATAGYYGTATAGYRGTATAGDRGTATAGYYGTATAGDRGVIVIHWYDDARGRWLIAVGQVGEDGIVANTPYRVENGKLVAVKQPTPSTKKG